MGSRALTRLVSGLAASLLSTCVSGACTGVVGDVPNKPPPPDDRAAGGAEAEGPRSEPRALKPARLIRITAEQYRKSVEALVGVKLEDQDFEDEPTRAFFTAIGVAETALSERAVTLYDQAASVVARRVMTTPETQRRAIPCTPGPSLERSCVERFVRELGRRAWRRPLDDAEVDRLTRVVQAGGVDDVAAGFELGIRVLLSAPSFVYRAELAEPDPDDASRLRYSGYDLASKLSFFLTDHGPDDALLEAAASGKLSTVDGIRAEAIRLIESGQEPSPGLLRFMSELFALSKAATYPFPATLASPTLVDSLRAQASLMLRDSLTTDLDIRSLFSTPRTYVNADVARVLGIPGVSGLEMRPHTFAPDAERAGILTTPALLTLGAEAGRTSPTQRGLFVAVRLECKNVPPPPPNVDTKPPEASGGPPQSVRERIAAHQTNPTCAACHALMDPIGLGLEDFDQFGRRRTRYDNGTPVDASAELDGVTFSGAKALGRVLSESDGAGRCLAAHLFRYAMVRESDPGDRAALEDLSARFAERGFRLRELVLDLVTSKGFRFAGKE